MQAGSDAGRTAGLLQGMQLTALSGWALMSKGHTLGVGGMHVHGWISPHGQERVWG